ncbi:hypothetical protein PAMC26510_12510 [Caballeronia sordidicola]|uniref:Uncharacterized protein n=1 Tax=Caballeronia sordidicola TaxID=196367 RepID=A0A242MWZ2_CABSO|nr:hypothetical protein PAMC26510_12510 [Caballeronia sordidicola]
MNVALNFFLPIITTCHGNPATAWAIVPMPKTSMDKYRSFSANPRYIWAAG